MHHEPDLQAVPAARAAAWLGGGHEGMPWRALSRAELASQLGWLAQAALVAEAWLSPKPGLVDRRGPGAHRDLSLDRLLASADALRPGFTAMAALASDPALPPQLLRLGLADLGREAEQDMLRATGGANAHRGAIWSLGLSCGAAAQAWAQAQGMRAAQFQAQGQVWRPSRLMARVARIARCPDVRPAPGLSHGQAVRLRHGLPGAREEAQAGFPHVRRWGLPVLCQARARGLDESFARLDSLMALMSHLPDTCLLHRGGLAGLHSAQRGAALVLACGGSSTPQGGLALQALDRCLLRQWLSPGGSADLLATTLFLDALGHPAAAQRLLNDLKEAMPHGNLAI